MEQERGIQENQDSRSACPCRNIGNMQRRKVFYSMCIYAAFFSIGWVRGLYGPALIDILFISGVTLDLGSLVFTCNSVGYAVGCMGGGYLSDRGRRDMTYGISLLSLAILIVVTPWCSQIVLMIVVHLGQGVVTGIVDTGLYEESHGIIANDMHDPEFKDDFSIGSFPGSKWWDQGEPVWITARKHDLTSGTIHWPGGYIDINGISANKIHKYNRSVPFDYRVDLAVDMLAKDKFNFVAVYFHEPDNTGHIFGPESSELVKMVEEMDRVLGQLLDKLKHYRLTDSVNLIVASDHGMTATSYDNKLINIYDLVDRSMIKSTLEIGAIMQVVPEEGKEDHVILAINRNPNLKAYKRDDIPEMWRLKNNRRVMPIFVIASEGWTITNDTQLARQSPRAGEHGYDNSLMTMKPIFYAMGPNFRSGISVPPFRIIDIYPMICELLGIPPSPNNGTLNNTASFLRLCQDTPRTTSWWGN